MLLNFFTLRALTEEWNERLSGATLADAYTQDRGSLILVFARRGGSDVTAWSVNVSVQSPNRHLFLYDGTNRARRNTVDVFEDAVGLDLDRFEIADRDRIITIRLSSAEIVAEIIIVPFGPRANIFLRMGGEIVASFRGDDEPPEARRAPDIPDELTAGSANDVSRALPMFSKTLAREVIHRLPDEADSQRAAEVARRLETRLLNPDPVVYWDGRVPEVLSMTPLEHLDAGDFQRENFETATEAVRVVARRRLGLRRFDSRYDPLKTRLEERFEQTRRSLDRVQEELESPSRADRYETWGHLLMAQPHLVPSGVEEVQMDDIVEGTGTATIPLDPAKSAIENAEAYYDRARRTRKSRENAERRLAGMEAEIERLEAAVEEIGEVSDRDELEAFESRHSDLIDELRSGGDSGSDFPYRRYVLHGGYEVWVGRNARQNDQLTLRDARKYDLWLHARGVPGSHTVLRVKGRKDNPPKAVIEQAAAIAAYHSKARTSGLAPVMVTEKKYVRKPRNAHPGAVAVEREEVLMVEPRLP